ncbi:hypothetical protein WNJ68_20620 [Klebsiella grimontii]|uniref:hypothetical protein n=1 Tax=Klebsiella grimontii TaxID=2058152 RepID=UPI003100E5EE
MTELTEKPAWSGVTQLSRLDRVEGGRQGAANMQAQQLVQRTAWLKEMMESASDYREYTFYVSEDDPNGTIAGLAGTPDERAFRVAVPDGDGVTVAFNYFKNNGGVAEFINSQPSNRYVESLVDYVTQEVIARAGLVFSDDSTDLLTISDRFGFVGGRITENSFETVNLKLFQQDDGPALSTQDRFGNSVDILSARGNLVVGDNELHDSELLSAFEDKFGNQIKLLDSLGRLFVGDNILYDDPEWAFCVTDRFGWIGFGQKTDGTVVGISGGSSDTEPAPSVLENNAEHWLFGRAETSYRSRTSLRTLTPQSEPEYHHNYISLAGWGGALVTDIPDSGVYTICAVVRVPAQTPRANCVVVYGTQDGYSQRDDDDSFTGNQLSLFSDLNDRRWIRSKISGYRATSRRYPDVATPADKWLFVSHVVRMTGDGPRYQSIYVGDDEFRELREADADRLILSGRNVAIGNAYCDISMFKSAGLDVAEFIYFDKALSAEELKNVYENSRQRMAERAINLR